MGQLLKLEVVENSVSDWEANLVFVPKNHRGEESL